MNVVWLELPTQRAGLPKTSEEFAHFARIQQGWLSFAVEIIQYKKKTEFDLHGSFGLLIFWINLGFWETAHLLLIRRQRERLVIALEL